MAKIRALRAWRYNDNLSQHIGDLISPPFDVVTPAQREALYLNPLNSIHLSVPSGPNPAEHAADTLLKWKKEGIIVQEQMPCIYVYYQYFRLPGLDKEFCRKGFICLIEAAFWEDEVVLRHENTIPGSVSDRIELLDKTQLNASPTHGLYTDESFALEPLMDTCMENPVYQAEDYQGVKDVLGIISDEDLIRTFADVMREKQIILADGHHRYESSLAYRRKQMQQNPNCDSEALYNYHLMYLSNTESEDLKVQPTHRLIANMPEVWEEEMLERAAKYFIVEPLDDVYDIPEIIAGKRWTFGLMLHDRYYKIRLKPEMHAHFESTLSDDLKQLDIVVLHHFFIDKVLGIAEEDQRRSPFIGYERSFATCLFRVSRKEVQMALITNGVSIKQIKEICYSGHLLPQKSTYFYPKAICGFLFASIREYES